MHLRLTTILMLAACATDPSLQDEELDTAARRIPRPDVPDAIAVPADHRVAFVGHATGVQIYECAPDASAALTWRLRAPRADLTVNGKTFVKHFGGVDAGLTAGPYWKSIRDGSWVRGGNAVSSPNPDAIPFLRVEVLDGGGAGIFGDVTFIHRLATVGGVGPAGACTDPQARVEVPYESDYYFYRPSDC
jgi:hypothetical protein